MADCSFFFVILNQSVSLTNTDRKLLRAARNAVTKKIRKYFEDNHLCRVSFKVQGSFTMNTIVKPANGDYDIDVGVYLEGFSNWQKDWPKAETASQWLIKALDGHTDTAPVNKQKCVRIIYKHPTTPNSIGYHVDLPIYREYYNLLDNLFTRIAINGDTQWDEKSDPLGFTKWFYTKCQQNKTDKNQLVRLVKYFKAWKISNSGNVKFPSGMALTIMMAENYCSNEREDLAFCNTIEKIYETYFTGILPTFDYYCVRSPVEPYNNLLLKLTDNQISIFKECLRALMIAAKQAINEQETDNSLNIWQKQYQLIHFSRY